MKNKLIALLTNNDDDIYCFRLELVEALLKDGYQVLISCPDGPKFEMMRDIPYLYDNPKIDRRGTNAFSDFKLLLHYYRLFLKYKPGVVLTYTAKPNVYGGFAARWLRIPYICNVTGLGSVEKKRKLVKSFILSLFKMSYRHADCIMFQNETNREMAIQSEMVGGREHLIPGSGVALNRFSYVSYPSGGDGLRGPTVIFNYIGRVLKDKGIADYIEVARRIKAEYPNTEFNILGFIEPTEEHFWADLNHLQKEGIVNYLGEQKDVRPFIAKSHATIHPSTYGEGMSNVLLETAAVGRAILTTDNPGCRETVLPNVSGFVYPSGNVDALEGKVKQFLKLDNKEREQMGKKGREYMESHFSRNIVINAYEEEVKMILGYSPEME